jgi:hypothetical protein
MKIEDSERVGLSYDSVIYVELTRKHGIVFVDLESWKIITWVTRCHIIS